MDMHNKKRQWPLTFPLLWALFQAPAPNESREFPIWRPRDITQPAFCNVLHVLNFQFLSSSIEEKNKKITGPENVFSRDYKVISTQSESN